MPYAIFDRDAFIARTGLGPDMKVLSMGPDHIAAARAARNVETGAVTAATNIRQARGLRAFGAHAHEQNPVVTKPDCQPFKGGVFDIIFSYHGLNFTPPGEVPGLLGEARRMLKDNCRLASLVWSLKPTNDAQFSHKMLLDILDGMGILHLHSFGEVSRWLEAAGFEEITMELVTQEVSVPDKWVRSHLKQLDGLIREQAARDASSLPDLEDALETYSAHVEEYGEELLPSIQFTARRTAGLSGIDIVR